MRKDQIPPPTQSRHIGFGQVENNALHPAPYEGKTGARENDSHLPVVFGVYSHPAEGLGTQEYT